jgi:hypothetical protein
MAGNISCGSLIANTKTVGMAFKVDRGVNTQPAGPVTVGFNWKAPGNRDMGCVKPGRPAVQSAGTGTGVGKAFTLPAMAFTQAYPRQLFPADYMFKTDIPVVEIKLFPPALQLATSVYATAGPNVRAHYGGTQFPTAPAAPFRKFKAGAWVNQTGRAAANFTWCPPPLTMLGNPGITGCGGFGLGGFPGMVKYTSGGNAFGGTMSLVTHQVAGVGSIALGLGGRIAFNNFGGGESLATGRGYADYNKIYLPPGDIHKNYTVKTRTIGPRLGKQKVVGMVAPTKTTFIGLTMWPGGKVYDWGFPWTTMTVFIRAKNGMGTKSTSWTAMGWDCAKTMQGPACSKTPTRGFAGVTPVQKAAIKRNISLVAGSVGLARLGPPFGDAPIANMGNMQLLVMPEPGATLQLLAGVGGLAALAARRSRRTR